MVLTDCFIKISDVTFSGAATSVAISYSAEAADITAFGDTTRNNIGGLLDWSMAFEFNADESVTGEMFDMVGTVVGVEVRAKSTAISAANPAYKGQALVTEYSPIDGSVGDKHTVSMSVVSAGELQRLEVAPV
jgi:hypothetical protein